MKKKLFAAVLAIMSLGVALPAGAQEFERGGRGYGQGGYEQDFHGGRWRHAQITIRNDGRQITVGRDDRLFYRLLDRPYNFRPGLTYAYTDRCNRYGCVAFVFDGRHRRPIDRIFAPHLPMRGWAWRQGGGFDGGYRNYGDYDRDERGWSNEYDRQFRQDRDRGLLGSPNQH